MKNKLDIQTDVSLAPLTTFKIGGPARYFLKAASESEVKKGVEFARTNSIPLFILGGGSNILVSDEGFDGLVLQICLKGIDVRIRDKETSLVEANAGEDWDNFVEFCVGQSLQGVECLSGIPGFVGGTPVQNVGAYGQEVSETISSVRCFDRFEDRIIEMSSKDCGFAYRTSIFNTLETDRYIVLKVVFVLKKATSAEIRYADLKREFGESMPTLSEIRRAVLRIRAAKSMVISPEDPNSRCAGSFFKNPLVSISQFEALVSRAKDRGMIENREDVPCFTVDDVRRKIPAAWLIENAGFYKGFSRGNVGISTKHALSIINRGGARAVDLIEFKSEIQRAVKEYFGIDLVPEPNFIGF